MIRDMGSALFDFPFKLIVYFTLAQIFPFITKYIKVSMIPKNVEIFFTGLMNDAIQMRLSSGIKRDDYLNFLLELQKKKNLESIDLAAHTLTFFLDGYETSSAVIANILYRLASNKHAQNVLRREIEESVTKNNGNVTFESIHEMEYLDQVFNGNSIIKSNFNILFHKFYLIFEFQETIRITPAVGMMFRRCTETTEFTDYKDKKLIIDKGIVVAIPVYSIHTDPLYYPNPDVFDPERFSAANGGIKSYKDKGVFLAWGEGPRICLGKNIFLLNKNKIKFNKWLFLIKECALERHK